MQTDAALTENPFAPSYNRDSAYQHMGYLPIQRGNQYPQRQQTPVGEAAIPLQHSPAFSNQGVGHAANAPGRTVDDIDAEMDKVAANLEKWLAVAKNLEEERSRLGLEGENDDNLSRSGSPRPLSSQLVLHRPLVEDNEAGDGVSDSGEEDNNSQVIREINGRRLGSFPRSPRSGSFYAGNGVTIRHRRGNDGLSTIHIQIDTPEESDASDNDDDDVTAGQPQAVAPYVANEGRRRARRPHRIR
ncbi:hypothetical protein QFC22_005206 [Naganishia vaughanmartiniae]|uniref:Uncharacterized protein n=1 Tax=Naganishia vaughanmartiniae TaxID=1424756 RepID=A0ACC2WUI4_9TREE|nr:hypothetical protein QFC22_005206 [Naganishia vaughanmartiniae]